AANRIVLEQIPQLAMRDDFGVKVQIDRDGSRRCHARPELHFIGVQTRFVNLRLGAAEPADAGRATDLDPATACRVDDFDKQLRALTFDAHFITPSMGCFASPRCVRLLHSSRFPARTCRIGPGTTRPGTRGSDLLVGLLRLSTMRGTSPDVPNSCSYRAAGAGLIRLEGCLPGDGLNRCFHPKRAAGHEAVARLSADDPAEVH